MAADSQGGGGAKFNAKRVPDFAKLHALEDARVARWKRQNKRDVTVPLGVRFLPAAPPSSSPRKLPLREALRGFLLHAKRPGLKHSPGSPCLSHG